MCKHLAMGTTRLVASYRWLGVATRVDGSLLPLCPMSVFRRWEFGHLAKPLNCYPFGGPGTYYAQDALHRMFGTGPYNPKWLFDIYA